MPTCQRRKITFFHITKTAGTTVEKYLGLFNKTMNADNDTVMFGTLKHGPAQHYPFEIFYQYRPEEEKNYFKFSFVRNPYDRIVSQYYWQLTRMRNLKDTYSFKTFLLEAEELVSNAICVYPAPTPYFTGDFFNNDEFMKVPTGNKIHFCPQHMYIFDEEDKFKLDFFGSFENFTDDFTRLCLTIDVNASIPARGFGYRTHNVSAGRPPYREMYDSTTKKIVERMYEKDLDLLKYTF